MITNQTHQPQNELVVSAGITHDVVVKEEEELHDTPSFLSSVTSRPSFKLSRGKSFDDEKSEVEQDAEGGEVHEFCKAEWNTYLDQATQEWNADDGQSTRLSISTRSTSDWFETAGESETMEYYEATNTGVFDPAAKVLQKYREDQDQFLFMCSVIPSNDEQLITEQEWLLPPRNPKDTRKTLVLDLDETLVHSFLEFEESTTYDWTFQVESENGIFDVFCRVRPHLEEFLKECAKMFELVLFTASQDNYANKVLDHVDPAGYIQHRLFRRHCTKVRGNFVKDLSLLGRSLSQTIIIDNSPLTFALQPSNGIPCDNWFDDQMDQELLQLLPILRHLKEVEDVRDELAELYQVGRFLSELSLVVSEYCEWMCLETF